MLKQTKEKNKNIKRLFSITVEQDKYLSKMGKTYPFKTKSALVRALIDHDMSKVKGYKNGSN